MDKKLFKAVLKDLERNGYVKIFEHSNAMKTAGSVIKKNNTKSTMS